MLKLELKRIFSKKINVFAIGLALILAVIFSGFAVTSNRYVDENGNASTGIMATRKLTDNRRAWKGTLTEDELGKVIEQNKNAVTQSSEENPKAIPHPPERTTFMEVQAEPDMIGNYSEM